MATKKRKEWRLTIRLPAELRAPIKAEIAAGKHANVNWWLTAAARDALGRSAIGQIIPT